MEVKMEETSELKWAFVGQNVAVWKDKIKNNIEIWHNGVPHTISGIGDLINELEEAKRIATIFESEVANVRKN